jgi:hypothetical protein
MVTKAITNLRSDFADDIHFLLLRRAQEPDFW